MAERPIVNVPAADQLLRLYRGIARQDTYLAVPVLAPWRDVVAATIARLDGAIAPRAKQVGVPAARAAASGADVEHDRAHRFFYGLVTSFGAAPDEALRAASATLLATLYPDKLHVVNASWADEVAAGPIFAKKLALPEVDRALAALAAEVPKIRAAASAVVTAAAALGAALDAVDAAMVDDAGKPGSELFAVRSEAQSRLSVFAQLVSTVAYPSDGPEDKAARQALLGPYLRYLAAVPRSSSSAPQPDAGSGAPLPADADA